jgi:hypothetical protein
MEPPIEKGLKLTVREIGKLKGQERFNAIAYEARRRSSEASLDAIDFLYALMKDESEDLKYRIKASEIILERGLGLPHQAIIIKEETDKSSSPAMMTNDQLRKFAEGKHVEAILEMKRDGRLDKILSDNMGANAIDGEISE